MRNGSLPRVPVLWSTVVTAHRGHASAALKATRDVSVELSELRFADPSLMIDLACLAQRLRAHGRTLCLRDPQPHIHRLIELVGLHRLPSVRVVAPEPASTLAAG